MNLNELEDHLIRLLAAVRMADDSVCRAQDQMEDVQSNARLYIDGQLERASEKLTDAKVLLMPLIQCVLSVQPELKRSTVINPVGGQGAIIV